MGNFCCQDRNQRESNSTVNKRKRISGISTSSNQPANIQKLKIEEEQIISILSSSAKRISTRQSLPQISKVNVISQLGKGGQAEVYSVNIEVTNPEARSSSKIGQSPLALKRINLNKQLKNSKSIELASQLLIQNDCPFIIKGLFCFKTKKYFYQCMDIAEGGDLTSFMETTIGKGDAFRKLGQQGIRMVLAGIILGLQYIHQKKLIYCDLKTDNILIGKDGYPLLADFELLKNQENIRSSDYKGTPTIIGPQIFTKPTFDKSMDLWSLGIVIYNIVYNQIPYSVQEIFDQNFINQAKKKEKKYKLKKKKSSDELSDLINKLLLIQPKDRIGYNSLNQIKQHDFFYNFDWQAYAKKEMYNPIAEIVKKYPLRKTLMQSRSSYQL